MSTAAGSPPVLTHGAGLVEAVAQALAEATPEIAVRVAAHVAAMLGAEPMSAVPRAVDAATLARRLGVTRGFVYEHADELGGARLGDGPRARLRFDLDRALQAWNARSTSEESQQSQSPASTGSTPARRSVRIGRRATGLPEPGSVLAIRGSEQRRRAA